jgi:hypothetical protein
VADRAGAIGAELKSRARCSGMRKARARRRRLFSTQSREDVLDQAGTYGVAATASRNQTASVTADA